MIRSKIIASLALGSLALIMGCSNSPTGTSGLNGGKEDPTLAISQEEASGVQIAKETAELGQIIAYTTSLSKSAVNPDSGVGFSLSGQILGYAGGWWTRSGKLSLTGDQGEKIEVNGYDSAQFKNAAGSAVAIPIFTKVTSVALMHMCHFDIQNREGGYIDLGRTFTFNAALNAGEEIEGGSAGNTFVLNGSISQYFKAENADKTAWCDYKGNARAVDITFKKTAGVWSKPVSGTINVSSPYRTIDITFTDGSAQVTVSDKSGQVKLSSKIPL